jgi:IclR family pca regulon transcriptional regulator
MPERPYTVASLAKGLKILSLFSEQRHELRLTDLAELAQLPVPTVFRLVKTLEAAGYIEQGSHGRFRPGLAVLNLGFAALTASDLVDASRVPLDRLAKSTGETVNLGILLGASVLYLHRIRNTDLVTASIQVGSLLPPQYTSMGKVLLAWLEPDHELFEQLEFSGSLGPRAVSSLDELRAELADVRQRRYALQDEEIAAGVRSLAAPVMDTDNSVTAAVNLAVQSSRWSVDELTDRFLQPLLRTASEISQRLGRPGEPHEITTEVH